MFRFTLNCPLFFPPFFFLILHWPLAGNSGRCIAFLRCTFSQELLVPYNSEQHLRPKHNTQVPHEPSINISCSYHIHIHANTQTRTHTRTHTHTHTHARTHARTHACTHARTQAHANECHVEKGEVLSADPKEKAGRKSDVLWKFFPECWSSKKKKRVRHTTQCWQ